MKKVVIKEEAKEISVSQVDKEKTYIYEGSCGDLYKACCIDHEEGKFVFQTMTSSYSWGTGEHESLQSMIKSAVLSGSVYEFETPEEFYEWALNR